MRQPFKLLQLQVAIFLIMLVASTRSTESEAIDTCTSGESGSCDADSGIDVASSLCTTKTSWLYSNGGSAQAYKPDAPISNEVCSADISDKYRYKPASWPFSRKSMRVGRSPKLDVTLKLYSCTQKENNKCQCNSISSFGASSKKESVVSSVIEIWQTKPDGTYSALRSSMPDGDECRAQVPLVSSTKEGRIQFTTVAPGSTGIMGGLGPGGWDWNPYGSPKLHLLTRVQGYAPLLVDLPIMFHPDTLEPRKKFFLGELNGVSWTRGKPKEKPIVIRSWDASSENRTITLEIDIYLQPSDQDQPDFCPSYFYGLPTSFFLEPMSVCAPSMLDFYAL